MVRLLDEGGNVTAYYEYDAFGNVLREEESTLTQEIENRFRYQSNWQALKDDPNKRYYLSAARIYDTLTGRFLQRDPACAMAGKYLYCRNKIICRVDNNGRDDTTTNTSDSLHEELENLKRKTEELDKVRASLNREPADVTMQKLMKKGPLETFVNSLEMEERSKDAKIQDYDQHNTNDRSISVSTEGFLDKYSEFIPSSLGVFEGSARFFVLPFMPPAGTIEIVGFFNGQIDKCCHKDKGTIGLMATGSFGLKVSGGVGTSVGGTTGVKATKTKRGNIQYHEKGKVGAVKAPTVGKRGFSDKSAASTSTLSSVSGSIIGELPTCATELDLTVTVGVDGFASVGISKASVGPAFDFDIGSCSIKNGCQWNANLTGTIAYGMGTGAIIEVYGRGEVNGSFVLRSCFKTSKVR